MNREDSLDADAVRYFPDREGLLQASAAAADDDPFEILDALLVALDARVGDTLSFPFPADFSR